MRQVRIIMAALLLSGLSSCDYRVPSKKIFEDGCAVKIPEGYSILEDKDNGNGENRGIEYTIQLQSNSRKEFIESINNSPHYLYPDNPSDTGWKMKGPGYLFYRMENAAVFTAQFDTGKGVVSFAKTMK